MPDHLRSAEGATAQNDALASLDLPQQVIRFDVKQTTEYYDIRWSRELRRHEPDS
jgi:hypothetical protein